MDAAGATLLFRLLSMGTSSLLQYTSESSPWSAANREDVLAGLMAIAREERDEVDRLTRVLQKKRIRIPAAASYPSHFTTANFVSVEYLLPKLIAEHELEIAEIERQLHPEFNDEIRGLADPYLAMKRRHIDTLRHLIS